MDSAIDVRGLHKSYGDVEAVRGVDLSVDRGEVFALLGPNGAGKTTTVEILEGYRTRTAGEVSVLRIRRPDEGGNVSYTLAQFDAVYPEVADNLEVDPRFTDEANRVFTLREDSPAAGW